MPGGVRKEGQEEETMIKGLQALESTGAIELRNLKRASAQVLKKKGSTEARDATFSPSSSSGLSSTKTLLPTVELEEEPVLSLGAFFWAPALERGVVGVLSKLIGIHRL